MSLFKRWYEELAMSGGISLETWLRYNLKTEGLNEAMSTKDVLEGSADSEGLHACLHIAVYQLVKGGPESPDLRRELHRLFVHGALRSLYERVKFVKSVGGDLFRHHFHLLTESKEAEEKAPRRSDRLEDLAIGRPTGNKVRRGNGRQTRIERRPAGNKARCDNERRTRIEQRRAARFRRKRGE
jgi:hypothetical protein